MIKYPIAHKICESNFEWNSNKNQNREIIKSLLKFSFLSFLPIFDENFEMESWLEMLLTHQQIEKTKTGKVTFSTNYILASLLLLL